MDLVESWAVRDRVEDVFGPEASTQAWMVVGGVKVPYTDRNSREWVVGVYLESQRARDRAESLNAWCKDNDCHISSPSTRSGQPFTSGAFAGGAFVAYAAQGMPVPTTASRPKSCPLDPQFATDDWGTDYVVRPCTVHF